MHLIPDVGTRAAIADDLRRGTWPLVATKADEERRKTEMLPNGRLRMRIVRIDGRKPFRARGGDDAIAAPRRVDKDVDAPAALTTAPSGRT